MDASFPPPPQFAEAVASNAAFPAWNSILTARKVIIVPFRGIGWRCLFNTLPGA